MFEIGKTYRLYGKISPMKRMKPVSGSTFVTNLIYANLYYVRSQEDIDLMNKELVHLNEQGTFEFRRV